MLPNVAIISRPAGPPVTTSTSTSNPTDPTASRKAQLAAEARRLAHRRLIADLVARRSLDNDRKLRGDAPGQLFRRARHKAVRLRLVFHRSIEALWEAGGFDEALAIFREHQRECSRLGAPIERRG